MDSKSAEIPGNEGSRLRFRQLLRPGSVRDVRFCPVLPAFASTDTEDAKRTERRETGEEL